MKYMQSFRWQVLATIIATMVFTASPVAGFEPDGGKAVTINGYTWIPAQLNNDAYDDLIIFTSADGCMWKWYGTAASSGGSTKRWNFQQQICFNGKAGSIKDAQLLPMDFNGDTLTDLLILPGDGKCYWKWYSTNTIGPNFDFKQQCCINQPCTGD